MHEDYELIRAVTKHGEAVTVVVAARLGIPISTAYRWVRFAAAESAPGPTFVEVADA